MIQESELGKRIKAFRMKKGQGVIPEFKVSAEAEALMFGSWDRDIDCDGDLGGVTGDGEV
jgi:hypothetical protein